MDVKSFNTSIFHPIFMAAKFCPVCGYENDPTNQFCAGCGAALSVSDSPSPPEVSTPEPQVFPESSEIKYASDGDRFVAYIIDSILFGLAGKLFGLMFGLAFFGPMMSFEVIVDNWPVTLASFLYFFLFEAFNKGQTPGKIALKIQTVDSESLGDLTPAQAAVNAIGKAFFLGLDIIIGLVTREDKSAKEKNAIRFTQRASKTSVIKLE